MPYQRLIFSLLYDSGSFCLSRNFRLQRVGSINWLLKNYDLAALCSAIDELVLLNVSRSPFEEKYNQKFFDDLNLILQHCFCPVTIGGGVAMLDHAKRLIGVGADKVVISTAITHNLDLVHQISQVYGAQAVSLWLDCTHSLCRFNANTLDFSLSSLNNFVKLNDFDFGDVVLHSIDRDGTGQGFDHKLINAFSTVINDHPLILSGGAGKVDHFAEVLRLPGVSGVATANLLNFIGSDMRRVRYELVTEGFSLASWN